MTHPRLVTALVCAALALGGCGLGTAASSSTSPAPDAATDHATSAVAQANRATSPVAQANRVTSAVAQANRTHEVPTPASPQTVLGGWRRPAQAVAVFAATYINWTAATVSVRLRALAEVCVGQARSALLLTAAQSAGDYELHRSGVVNQGTVESVAPLAMAPRQYVVVTREQTSSTDGGAYRGLAPAWHVTLATVTRVSGGLWVLSRWQPES